ncbi:L,D-transpeptidase family protein [Pectobacteriaceae bacterium CE70]|nr:L,D-transpeptidase family protein [Pectobacteriaceae bacterium C52]WJV67639.1 L,D-transpeptidase family protein [Pectobacteriaceae bacterium CE70]WJY11581.1 L,D-transpeptidase family protein [Pectobacteriaceae bacterium C80]
MKMSIRATLILVLAAVTFSQAALAVVYPLPAGKGRLVGENIHVTIPKDSTQPLEHFAAEYQMGLSNMMEANPGIDAYLPRPGRTMLIPQQLILPDTPHEGIIINSAEMRLYYYPKGTNTVIVLPIGIGELGKDTPINWITSVQRKKARPTWTPTAAMHAEYAARGETLPEVYPAGPDNPMGLYALYVGRLYAIHGTNANFGIGLRVSHGCVRLRDKDIKYLFDHIPVGTRVQFINEPVKATVEPDGSRYIEVHHPLSRDAAEFNSNAPIPITLPDSVAKILADPSVNEHVTDLALRNRLGIPVKVNGPAEEVDPEVTPAPETQAPIIQQASATPATPDNSPSTAQPAATADGSAQTTTPATSDSSQSAAQPAATTDGSAQTTAPATSDSSQSAAQPAATTDGSAQTTTPVTPATTVNKS